jgi:hypothetical protein
MTTEPTHQPEPWYYEAGSSKCPHGPRPDYDSPEYDAWDEATSERHRPSDECVICLDAPMGDVCEECSQNCGEAVPWSACEVRRHAKPKPSTTPTPNVHAPVEVWVGTTECLEGNCLDLYDDEGDPIPGRDRCPHTSVELICGGCSTLDADGYYAEPTVQWPGEHTAPLAGVSA